VPILLVFWYRRNCGKMKNFIKTVGLSEAYELKRNEIVLEILLLEPVLAMDCTALTLLEIRSLDGGHKEGVSPRESPNKFFSNDFCNFCLI
jgi:hypothetical protein